MKAWTICTAFSDSLAMALVSARRSWEARESLRTFRPIVTSGRITAGISRTMRPMSLRFVMASITSAPGSWIIERSTIERLVPVMDWTSVVSAVRRESISPVRVTSKNIASMRMTCR